MKKENNAIGGLPTYFVIKQDKTNPLWTKYIEWLNKEYSQDWEGGAYGYFYGYDGNQGFTRTKCRADISLFENNPTELTLAEWDRIINNPSGKEENDDIETFSPGEQVGCSNESVETALEDLKTDDYTYYYIGKSKYGKYVVEDNNGITHRLTYICKIPTEVVETILPLTDEEIVKLRKLIG